MISILTVQLRVIVEYSDIEYYCKSSAISTPFIFTLEIENNKAIRGSLKKDGNPLYRLDPRELENIRIISDSGLSWIKSMILSDDMLRLFIYGDSNHRNMCAPPENLDDLKSNTILVDFGVSSVGDLLPKMLNSNQPVITGQTSKKDPYQIKLSFAQIRT